MPKVTPLRRKIDNAIHKLANIYALIGDEPGGEKLAIKTQMPRESDSPSTLVELAAELEVARGVLARLRNRYKKNDSDSDDTESLAPNTSRRAAASRVEEQIYSEIDSEIDSQTQLIESQTQLIPSQASGASSTSKDELAELEAQNEEAAKYVEFLKQINPPVGKLEPALKQGEESQTDDVNLDDLTAKLVAMTLVVTATATATATATDEAAANIKETKSEVDSAAQIADVNAAIDSFIYKVNIVQYDAQSEPSSEYASAVRSMSLPPPPPSEHADSPMSINPSQDVDLDENEMLAIETITNAVCYGLECVLPRAFKAVNLTLKVAYWTLTAANQNKYSRLLFILLLLVARKESATATTLTNEFARIAWVLSKMGFRLTLSATGIDKYIPAVRAWAASQVTIYAGVVQSIIDNYVTGKIAGFTADIDALLQKYAEEAAIIAQNMVAGAAQTAALNQLRTTFMDRMFGGAVNAAAGGVASAAMNSILGNIANAAAGGMPLLTGGRTPITKTTRKSKSNKKRKTRRHKKKTRRTRNRKGGKRRSRRIK
jgi:hypothetical protein